MAAWFKQGLSTLGEGLSTLTKEILSEDIIPPADGPPSLSGSLKMPSVNTQEHPDKSMEQFQQMVSHYEALLAEQRDRIFQLENNSLPQKLLNGTSPSPEQSSYIDSTDHEKFLDIDLAATTPSPDHSRVESNFPVLSAAQIHPDGFHRPLIHKDSVETGLVEAMEEELREKDVTIRHLMQEIARIKSESNGNGLVDMKDASSQEDLLPDKEPLPEKSETEAQTEELSELPEKVMQDSAVQFEPDISFSDGEAQTTELPYLEESLIPAFANTVDSFTQAENENELSESSSQTEVEFPAAEKSQAAAGSQTDDVSFSTSDVDVTEHPSQVTVECQTDEADAEKSSVSRENNQSTVECQTDVSAVETPPVSDSAFQTDDELSCPKSTTESQTEEEFADMSLESVDAEVQVEEEKPAVVTAEVEVQASEQVNQATADSQTDELDVEPINHVNQWTETEEIASVTSAEVQAGEQIKQATVDCQTDELPTELIKQINQWTETEEIATVTSAEVAVQAGERINQATVDCQTEEISSVSSEHSEVQTENTGSLISLEEYSLLTQDKQQLQKELVTAVEARERSKKEVERLKGHLLQVEQGYAQDFEGAQKREEELRQMVFQLQQQVEEGMSLQQHASSEVTEQIASLEKEVRVLLEARDDAMVKFHQAEKNAAQSEGSLSNLRMAFEHIKLEQRSELENERGKARKNVRNLEEKLAEVGDRCAFLENQAAQNQQDRAEQVRAQAEVESLRQQLLTLSTQLESTERALQAANEESSISSKSKVESALMKSMLLGYLIGPKGTKDDILRMMMSTLNFSDNEKQKVQHNQTSTLGSLFGRGTPGQAPEDSFGNMLVKFIEQESKPKESTSRSTTPLPPFSPAHSQVPQQPYRASSRPPPSLPDRSFSQRDVLESILNDGQADALDSQSHSSIDTV